VARQGATWRAEGLDLQLAVNVSHDCLSQSNFPDQVLECCRELGFPPSRLTIELTESRLSGDLTNTAKALSRMRLNKIELAIDDFGTGFASMEQLARMPFRQLKIDQLFVRWAGNSNPAQAVLESSVELGKKLGLRIVAEGIETRADWDRVATLGAEIAQGYFVAKPMNPEEVVTWVRHRASTSL